MRDASPPDEVRRLLDDRAAARRALDWSRADALRDQIAVLGWEVQDDAGGSTARPMLASASEAAEPLDEAATVPVSVQLAAEDHPEDLVRCLRGLAEHPPVMPWELLVVANAPAEPVEDALDAVTLDVEPVVLRSDERLGWADARTLGLRHSRGEVAILLDTSLEPTGDLVGPLLEAFDDPTVGIAGGWGVTSVDGHEFEEAPSGEVDADAAYALAIRREALRAVRGFDRRYRFYRNADLDLSFAVRDAGWRAVRTEPLPALMHEHRGWTELPDDERDRLSRRNFYRFLDRWGRRPDLLVAAGREQ